jgi:hypothetical protein
MKHKLIGLGVLGLAFTAVFAAQPPRERPINRVSTVNQDDGDKVKNRDEDSDEGKRRRLRPRFIVSSSKEAYDPSERIILTLTLSLKKHFRPKDAEEIENHALAQVTVETFEEGTITVVSATRNGKPIEPTLGVDRFLSDPVQTQVNSLKTIGSGEHVTIPFSIPVLPGQGSRLIVVRLHPESEHHALIYSLARPGWYTLQFRYLYTGLDDGKPNVFRGELISNPVSFLLRETHDKGQRGAGDGLECDPQDPEFADTDCQPALEHARTATPVGGAIVEGLEASSNTHVIMRSLEPEGTQTIALNENAYNGVGTSTIIEWNPNQDGNFLDGTPVEPQSGLTHELFHASVADEGGFSSEKVPGTAVLNDEIQASEVENEQRLHDGLPLRDQYCVRLRDGTVSCADIPPPSPCPSCSPGQSPGK